MTAAIQSKTLSHTQFFTGPNRDTSVSVGDLLNRGSLETHAILPMSSTLHRRLGVFLKVKPSADGNATASIRVMDDRFEVQYATTSIELTGGEPQKNKLKLDQTLQVLFKKARNRVLATQPLTPTTMLAKVASWLIPSAQADDAAELRMFRSVLYVALFSADIFLFTKAVMAVSKLKIHFGYKALIMVSVGAAQGLIIPRIFKILKESDESFDSN